MVTRDIYLPERIRILLFRINVLFQTFLKFPDRERFVIIKSLRNIAAVFPENIQLVLGLHAFRNAGEADFLCHVYHMMEHDILPVLGRLLIQGQKIRSTVLVNIRILL